jgi:hypothetical protein
MSEELKEVLIKRLKSLGWRVGGMTLVVLLSFCIEFATELQIPQMLVVFMGLTLSEVTKYLNR